MIYYITNNLEIDNVSLFCPAAEFTVFRPGTPKRGCYGNDFFGGFVKESKAVPQLFTVEEAAQYIHMGRTSFYECIRDGRIAFIRPPKGKILVRKTVLDSWLNKYEIPASKAPPWNKKEAAM